MSNPSPSRSRPSDRRLAVGIGVAVAAGSALGAWTLVDEAATEPLVTFEQAVPDDVESEAVAAVSAFRALFSARRSCVDGAVVVLVDEVEDGDARYLPAGSRIEIEIPTSPRRFRESLVHELAHHVEHRCAEFAELRERILDSTGQDTWSGQPRWADRPAEQWAEAVVASTLGERVRFADTMPLDPALVDAVESWAVGD